LAIPALVASGLLSATEKIYGSLRPSFYGLRTTLVAYVLLALLRILRAEALKEYPRRNWGRIVGLDRMPEVETLRLAHFSRQSQRRGYYSRRGTPSPTTKVQLTHWPGCSQTLGL
jgi:hypothetical protein